MRWVRAAMVLFAAAANIYVAHEPGVPFWADLALAVPVGYCAADVATGWRK